VIHPKKACRFAHVGVEQHETFCVFGLLQNKYHFRPSLVAIIACVKERHKRTDTTGMAVRRYEEPWDESASFGSSTYPQSPALKLDSTKKVSLLEA